MNSKTRNGMSHAEAGRLGAEKTKAFIKQRHEDMVEQYLQNPKHCATCGGLIPYERRMNKFCSHSCSAKSSNRTRVLNKKAVVRNKKAVKICVCCRKPIVGSGTKFCSMECSNKFKHLKKIEQVERTGEFPGGSGTTNSGEASRTFVRKYLEEKFGHRCSICGNTEWMGKPIPLVVDHIDGNPFNCKVDNFRLVCGNCDMQLDTYKGKNKGSGRAWRKKYSI